MPVWPAAKEMFQVLMPCPLQEAPIWNQCSHFPAPLGTASEWMPAGGGGAPNCGKPVWLSTEPAQTTTLVVHAHLLILISTKCKRTPTVRDMGATAQLM